MKYVVRVQGSDSFEELTESAFIDRKFAVTDDGKPRYIPDQYVIQDDSGKITEMQFRDAGKQIVGMICRYLGAIDTQSSIAGGFVRTPSHIKFVKNNSRFLLEQATGKKYRAVN